MYVRKTILASSILGVLALIASPAPAQNCECVDAAKPPYCGIADAQCWVSSNFYKNHIAESEPQARQKMLDAYTTGDKRERSTYFIPSGASFYKALKSVAGQAGKSTLTSGSTLDCSINPQKTAAQCVPAKSSQYAVCTTNGKIVHLMSTQNPCQ
jgi:hypothetical protein